MMKTVKAIASASPIAKNWYWPSARNDSSGPYADEESPSAPSPTQARNAISEMWWYVFGSKTSRGAPKIFRRRLASVMSLAAPRRASEGAPECSGCALRCERGKLAELFDEHPVSAKRGLGRGCAVHDHGTGDLAIRKGLPVAPAVARQFTVHRCDGVRSRMRQSVGREPGSRWRSDAPTVNRIGNRRRDRAEHIEAHLRIEQHVRCPGRKFEMLRRGRISVL